MENLGSGILFLLEQIVKLKKELESEKVDSENYRKWWRSSLEIIEELKEQLEQLNK
jgi:hypothetical protein